MGLAWGMKLRGDNHAVLCYCGDGATSEGDFHEAMNFAGVYRLPVVFLVVNNHWAISLPREKQTSSETPSEAAEIIAMVLRLLRRVSPIAFVTTHFLDLAANLEVEPPIDKLEFLQVEIDDAQRSTYQFIPGVASTSLAVGTARRLGVDFERLAAAIDERLGAGDPVAVPETTES